MPVARTEAIISNDVVGLAAEGAPLLRLLQQVAVFGRQLRQTMARLLAELDLNDTELLLLWVCGGAGKDGIAQNRLAAAVGLSPGQVSGLVDRMGRQGWIAPCERPGDRRRRLWQITPMGREARDRVLARLAPAATACEASAGAVGLDDLVQLLAGLGDEVDRTAAAERAVTTLKVFPDRTTATPGRSLPQTGKGQA
jgi:DNA-binding MarR family transcriptional regulator